MTKREEGSRIYRTPGMADQNGDKMDHKRGVNGKRQGVGARTPDTTRSIFTKERVNDRFSRRKILDL